jgi:hypothetical protein
VFHRREAGLIQLSLRIQLSTYSIVGAINQATAWLFLTFRQTPAPARHTSKAMPMFAVAGRGTAVMVALTVVFPPGMLGTGSTMWVLSSV